jgi:hypothetical protein
VRRRFLIDVVETLQVVAAPGISVLEHASRLLGVDPLELRHPCRARVRRCRHEDAKRIRCASDDVRCGVGNDHHVPARRSLLDRLADQCGQVVPAEPAAGRRQADRAHRPCLAPALRDRVEHAHDQGPPPFRVRDLVGADARFGRGPCHDLVVHVEKAELVRDQSSDLLAARAGGV